MAMDEESNDRHYRYTDGFGSIADFITRDEDRSTAVYRSFDKLATRNLLYFQSQLAELEEVQMKYDIEDRVLADEFASEGRKKNIRIRDWAIFHEASVRAYATPATASSPDTDDDAWFDHRWKTRMDLAMEIRKVLKEYREALIQEMTLSRLPAPNRKTMDALSHFFHNRGRNPTLSGASECLYQSDMSSRDIRASDYIALKQSSDDFLTRLLERYCWRFFRTRPPIMSPPPTIPHALEILHES
jgi:hypothetical protein